MVEFRPDTPGHVTLLREGQAVGQVRWSIHALSWGRERVKVALVEVLDSPKELTADLWDYLRYLWQKDAVAAFCQDGTLTWFSRALEQSWQQAGAPMDLAPEVRYRDLALAELDRELFTHFIRRQEVTDCWRREGEGWVIRPDPFVDDWSEEDYQFLVRCLKDTLTQGGFVYGAFVEGQLKGFVAVTAGLFGGENQYLDLASIHVSQDLRGKGIGKTLFRAAAGWARAQGAKKLYISAHSAVESQAFYAAMGCVDAQLPDPRHMEAEPFDRQLEFVL